MKRLSVALLLFLFAACPAAAQEIALEVKGGGAKVVEVDTIVVVKTPLTVVSAPPFTVHAPAGHALYFWTLPAGVAGVDKGDRLEVTTAPKGRLTISVKAVTADWDAKRFVTRFGSITFAVGEPGPGPDPIPPDPKPIPPDPKPEPAPIPVPGFRALIIYETAETTSSLSDVMSGNKTNDYMREKGVKGGFLKLDKDADVSGLEAWVGLAWRRPRATLPWLIISNGSTGYEGPVPKDASGRYSPQLTLDLLKKIGG